MQRHGLAGLEPLPGYLPEERLSDVTRQGDRPEVYDRRGSWHARFEFYDRLRSVKPDDGRPTHQKTVGVVLDRFEVVQRETIETLAADHGVGGRDEHDRRQHE